eukprot:4025831-Karenia_brevis.AAC.1
MDVNFVNGERAQIVVDSGAKESVCPIWWGSLFGTHRSPYQLYLKDAQGVAIGHFGQREIEVTTF